MSSEASAGGRGIRTYTPSEIFSHFRRISPGRTPEKIWPAPENFAKEKFRQTLRYSHGCIARPSSMVIADQSEVCHPVSDHKAQRTPTFVYMHACTITVLERQPMEMPCSS